MKFKNFEQKFKGNQIEDTLSPKLETLSTRSPMRLTEITIEKVCADSFDFQGDCSTSKEKGICCKTKEKRQKEVSQEAHRQWHAKGGIHMKNSFFYFLSFSV